MGETTSYYICVITNLNSLQDTSYTRPTTVKKNCLPCFPEIKFYLDQFLNQLPVGKLNKSESQTNEH